MPFTSELTGVHGGAQFTGAEYTNPAITQPFMNVFSDLFTIANRAPTPAPTAAEATALQAQLVSLINIAKNGISVQNEPGGKNVTYYMTAQMVDSLDSILSSLQTGGVTSLPNVTAAQLASWQTSVQTGTLATGLLFNTNLFNTFYYVTNHFSAKKVSLNTSTTATELATALAKTSGNVAVSEYAGRSLQAMTEVDYVNEGNLLINETLTEMYEALSLTKSTIDGLATLQDLHNQLRVVNRQDNMVYTRDDLLGSGGTRTFQSLYQSQISTFTNNLIPQLSIEDSLWLYPGATVSYDVVQTNPNGEGANTAMIEATVKLPSGQYYFINPNTGVMSDVLPGTEPQLKIRIILPLSGGNFPIPNTSTSIDLVKNLLGYQLPTNYVIMSPPTPTPGLLPSGVTNDVYGLVWPLITTFAQADELYGKFNNARIAFTDYVAALSAAAAASTSSGVVSSAFTNPQSLYNLAKKVLDDMPLDDTYGSLRNWIMDNYQSLNTTDATKAGAYQQNITAAITSAQATNDQQKETVRNNLFLFEEFYKSASTVLTQLNQIITKMAQNVGR